MRARNSVSSSLEEMIDVFLWLVKPARFSNDRGRKIYASRIVIADRRRIRLER